MSRLRNLAKYGIAFGAGMLACTCYLALRKTDEIDENPFSDDFEDDELWDEDLDEDIFEDLDSANKKESELEEDTEEYKDEYDTVSDGIGVGYGDRLFRLAYGVSREEAVMFIMSKSDSHTEVELTSMLNDGLGDIYMTVKENDKHSTVRV